MASRLFLTSAMLLFAELLLIRWIPANVVYVGFFNNLLLIASFLGIGLGILLGSRGWRPRLPLAALLLFALVVLVYTNQVNAYLIADEKLFLGGGDRREIDVNVLALALYVGLTAATMAALALPLGPLLRSLAPLRAYAVDIAGSLFGIAVFAALAALGTPPAVWFTVLAAFLVLVRGDAPILRPRTLLSGVAMAAVIGLAVLSYLQGDEYSAYYRINSSVDNYGRGHVAVNGIDHQTLHPLDSAAGEPFYEQVYQWFPDRHFDRALIIGAGTGTDVAVALAHGVGHVDAVEIDPRLLEIGVERHPDRPYDDARVTRWVNDGRAFLRGSSDRYDLIVLALTDSLTLVTTTANLRLESFLFTAESFESARDHLTPDGVFVLYNFYRQDWLVGRYARTLEEAFGPPPLVQTFPRFGGHGAVLAAGRPTEPLARRAQEDGAAIDTSVAPRPARDDWPFPYLRDPEIAPHYLYVLAGILAVAVVAVALAMRAAGPAAGGLSPHFFALGVAFLLLETRSLVTFSLLFGTTWNVNALAFAAILGSVLLAIAVNARLRFRRPRSLYVLLAASVAVAYAVPPQALLLDPAWLRYILASAITFAPVFAANLVFTYSFRETARADTAFASNLLGATLGGVLEYVALVTGYRQLLLVVAALYLLAFLFATRVRVFADRGLARPGASGA